MLDFFRTERKFKVPRVWSNSELKKFSHLFKGDIENISGWKDSDKDGSKYSEYFKNKKSYTITNYESDAMGYQGEKNEIYLDLTGNLPKELENKFDVVFNHTVLEHIFEVESAFSNICKMTKDIAIIVVPFLQPMHAEYGDYWRFTPTCLQKMFEKNNMQTLYSSFNHHKDAGVYVFCIASKTPHKWKDLIFDHKMGDDGIVNYRAPCFWNDNSPDMVGSNAIFNLPGFLSTRYIQIKKRLKSFLPI